MRLYVSEDEESYAVLVSKGYGSGWSTWNSMPELAYDRRVVEWYLKHNSVEFCNKVKLAGYNAPESAEHAAAISFFKSIGYEDVYFGGLNPDMVRWVPFGAAWRIVEHDGAEKIEFKDKIVWDCFEKEDIEE